MVLPGKVNLRWWRHWLTMDLPRMVGKTGRFIRTLRCGINMFQNEKELPEPYFLMKFSARQVPASQILQKK